MSHIGGRMRYDVFLLYKSYSNHVTQGIRSGSILSWVELVFGDLEHKSASSRAHTQIFRTWAESTFSSLSRAGICQRDCSSLTSFWLINTPICGDIGDIRIIIFWVMQQMLYLIYIYSIVFLGFIILTLSRYYLFVTIEVYFFKILLFKIMKWQ